MALIFIFLGKCKNTHTHTRSLSQVHLLGSWCTLRFFARCSSGAARQLCMARYVFVLHMLETWRYEPPAKVLPLLRTFCGLFSLPTLPISEVFTWSLGSSPPFEGAAWLCLSSSARWSHYCSADGPCRKQAVYSMSPCPKLVGGKHGFSISLAVPGRLKQKEPEEQGYGGRPTSSIDLQDRVSRSLCQYCFLCYDIILCLFQWGLCRSYSYWIVVEVQGFVPTISMFFQF